MSADKAQLLGLIGLRALAVRDPFEYRRVADLSIPELDQQIGALLKSVPDDDCRSLYEQAISIGRPFNADVILEEVAESSFRKAHLEALKSAESGTDTMDSLTNPGAVVAQEVARAGLKWVRPEHSEVMPFGFDEEFRILEWPDEKFLDALGNVANALCKPNVLEGSESAKESAIWNICERILQSKGKSLARKASKAELLAYAREGGASDWLKQNVRRSTRVRKSERT